MAKRKHEVCGGDDVEEVHGFHTDDRESRGG